MTTSGVEIVGYKANLRDFDDQILGVVTDRYKVVQNADALAFTGALLGEGVWYEMAGSLQNGKRIWLLAKLPEKYFIGGEQIEPYLVFSSLHDGSSAIKAAMTPIRVVCQNTLISHYRAPNGYGRRFMSATYPQKWTRLKLPCSSPKIIWASSALSSINCRKLSCQTVRFWNI